MTTRTIKEIKLKDTMAPGEGVEVEVYGLCQPSGSVLPILELRPFKDFKTEEPIVLNGDSARELWQFLNEAFNFSGTQPTP